MALCMAFVGLAQAQLSQGQTYSTKIVTGNRPGAGDWGLYFGPSYSEIMDLIETSGSQTEKAFGLPLINLKYYAGDRAEIRMGIQYNGHSETTNGTYLGEYGEEYGNRELFDNSKFAERRFRVSPGFAYHFSPKNVLDVYVGATIPIGLDNMRQIDESNYYLEVLNPNTEELNLKEYERRDNYKYNSFVIGVGAFIGLQAFVADLPLSLGFEYGLTGMLRTNDKVFHEATNDEGETQAYYTTGLDGFHYDELTNKSQYMGSDLRFTITYYFNNK